MHCTYCGVPKGTSRAEAMSNSEKIKPVALAVIELCLTEGISQAVSQKKILLNKNSMATFWGAFLVDLKACLHLVLPNQYYHIVVWEIEAGFRVILLRGPRLLLRCPYYEPPLWFMISCASNTYYIMHNITCNDLQSGIR